MIYYRETQDLAIRTRVSEEIRKYFVRQRRFSAKWVMIVTWLNVARYGGGSSPSVIANFNIFTRNTCLQQPVAFISKHCFNMRYCGLYEN